MDICSVNMLKKLLTFQADIKQTSNVHVVKPDVCPIPRAMKMSNIQNLYKGVMKPCTK